MSEELWSELLLKAISDASLETYVFPVAVGKELETLLSGELLDPLTPVKCKGIVRRLAKANLPDR